MKNIKKHLSLLMAVVMAISALTLVACNPNRTDSDSDVRTNGASHALVFETQSSPFVSLSATTATRATANGNVLEHVLTATVLPENAENKDVRWSVRWEDASRSENVSAYVKAITTSPYGNVATVTCYRPFTGNIVITATTVEGGFTAQCICRYAGLPSNLEVDLAGATIVTDTDWDTDILEVNSQTENGYAINLSNVFGEAGENFMPAYDITLEAFGGIYTRNTTYDASGALTGSERGEIALKVVNFYDTAYYCYAYFADRSDLYYFLNVRILDGKLYVIGQNSPAGYSWENTDSDGITTKSVYDGYVDGRVPYVAVTLTEKSSGLSYTFNVRTVDDSKVDVSGVTLDSSEIIF